MWWKVRWDVEGEVRAKVKTKQSLQLVGARKYGLGLKSWLRPKICVTSNVNVSSLQFLPSPFSTSLLSLIVLPTTTMWTITTAAVLSMRRR